MRCRRWSRSLDRQSYEKQLVERQQEHEMKRESTAKRKHKNKLGGNMNQEHEMYTRRKLQKHH